MAFLKGLSSRATRSNGNGRATTTGAGVEPAAGAAGHVRTYPDAPASGSGRRARGGSFEIPAWTFDRGNAKVYANPYIYADYRDTYPELMAGDGGQAPWGVE
ncbi:MAG: hypothetical protein IMZ44_07395 [Planctomycetes bacterium]|nr:hypothetical protein [Planctomycetota bacterium]